MHIDTGDYIIDLTRVFMVGNSTQKRFSNETQYLVYLEGQTINVKDSVCTHDTFVKLWLSVTKPKPKKKPKKAKTASNSE